MTNSSSFLAQLSAENKQVPTDQEVVVTPQVVEPTPIVEELVGEGKKFSDLDALAKAKLEADKHIELVQAENKALRDKVSQMDNNYTAILKKLEENNRTTNVSTQDTDAKVGTQQVDVTKLIEETLSKREREMQQKQNLSTSLKVLAETYGSPANAEQAVKALITERPYMATVIDNLAKTDHTLLLKEITAFKSPAEFVSKAINPVDNLRTANNIPNNSGYITWQEAKKVMISDPKKYSSKEYTNMVKASSEYYKSKGIDFYSQT